MAGGSSKHTKLARTTRVARLWIKCTGSADVNVIFTIKTALIFVSVEILDDVVHNRLPEDHLNVNAEKVPDKSDECIAVFADWTIHHDKRFRWATEGS